MLCHYNYLDNNFQNPSFWGVFSIKNQFEQK